MSKSRHIVILGGGLIGLSCADSLLRRGVHVSVIERTKIPGRGAAQFNSGMIHPSQATPWIGENNIKIRKQVVSLAQKSLSLLRRNRERLGCHDIKRPRATLQLFESTSERELALEHYQELAIETALENNRETFGRPAIRFLEDESGDAYDYMQRLSFDLAKRGCVFMTDIEAAPIVVNNQLRGVALANNHIVSADAAVIAAGIQSKDLAAGLGINLPLKSMRGHALIFDRPVSIGLPIIPIMHASSHSALTVFDSHVRLSGTINEESPDMLLEIWKKIAPDLIEELGEPKIRWRAERPMSLLGRPMIGPTSIDGLWVNTGHGHMGWSLCTASAELLADCMTNGKISSDFAVPGLINPCPLLSS